MQDRPPTWAKFRCGAACQVLVADQLGYHLPDRSPLIPGLGSQPLSDALVDGDFQVDLAPVGLAFPVGAQAFSVTFVSASRNRLPLRFR